ncbi:MAG: histidine kinase N-terminal 7TM domain-containing protein [Candidatus Omnitrophota bacterium]
MLYFVISAFTNAVVSTLACINAFMRHPRSPVFKAFGLFAGTVAFWSWAYFFWHLSGTAESALFWCRTLMGGAVFIYAAAVHFTVNLTESQKRYKKTVYLAYCISSLAFLLNFTPYFVADVRPRLFFNFWPTAGPTLVYFVIYAAWAMLFSIFICIRRARELSGDARSRLLYIALGLGIGFAGGFTNYPLWFDIKIPAWGNILGGYGFIVMVYGLLKYRLTDMTDFIKRFLSATACAVAVGVISLAFTHTIKSKFLTGVEEGWWIFATVITVFFSALGFLVFVYMIKDIEKKSEIRMKEARRNLEANAKGMIEIDSVDRLVKVVPRYLTYFYKTRLNVSIEHATIFLLNKEKDFYDPVSTSGRAALLNKSTISKKSPLYEWFTDVRRFITDNNIARAHEVSALKFDDINFWLSNSRLSALRPDMNKFLEELKHQMKRLKASVCVPGFFKDEIMGFLVLGHNSSGVYTQTELDLFSRFSADAMLAFRNAQLSDLIRRFEAKKAEAERLAATGELLLCVRHEMGNILNNIVAVHQGIKDAMGRSDFASMGMFWKMIDSSVERAKGIWSEVDGYKRKSESKDQRNFSLSSVINDVILELQELLNKNKIEFCSTIDPRMTVRGNELLPDLFRHLLINSCYAMEGIGGAVTFSAKRSDENSLEVLMTDTGRFDPLKREGGAPGERLFTQRGRSGGVNIFLARRIASDNGGSLSCKEDLPKGTKFIINFSIDS